jgi:hypothetical protein
MSICTIHATIEDSTEKYNSCIVTNQWKKRFELRSSQRRVNTLDLDMERETERW